MVSVLVSLDIVCPCSQGKLVLVNHKPLGKFALDLHTVHVVRRVMLYATESGLHSSTQ